MPACAYRSTTARVRLLLPKPSPRLLELEALESREPEKSGFPPARVLGFNFYLSPEPHRVLTKVTNAAPRSPFGGDERS